MSDRCMPGTAGRSAQFRLASETESVVNSELQLDVKNRALGTKEDVA